MPISKKTVVSGTELGVVLGVTSRRIEQLASDGAVVRTKRGRYLLCESVQRYFGRIVERQARKAGATTRLHEIRSADIEQRMAERYNTMSKKAEDAALAACDRVLGELGTDLRAIPARCTRDLSLRSEIDKEIENALNGAANRAASGNDSRQLGVVALESPRKAPARRVGRKKQNLSK